MERSRRGPHLCVDFAHNGVEVPSAATECSHPDDKACRDISAAVGNLQLLENLCGFEALHMRQRGFRGAA